MPLYLVTPRTILVPIEYLRYIERKATKCMYGHTLNLLNCNSIAEKLANHTPWTEEEIYSHLLAMQPHCNVDLYLRALAAYLTPGSEFREFFRDLELRS